jgi:hypothetical protein
MVAHVLKDDVQLVSFPYLVVRHGFFTYGMTARGSKKRGSLSGDGRDA